MLAKASTGKNRERFWKNAGKWTGRVDISEEESPGSKCSMHGIILTCSRLQRVEIHMLVVGTSTSWSHYGVVPPPLPRPRISSTVKQHFACDLMTEEKFFRTEVTVQFIRR